MKLIDVFFSLQSVYSNRHELDSEINRLQLAIENAKHERRDVAVLKEGEKAELVLPIMQSLCHDEKYRSVQDVHDQIDKLETELEKTQCIAERTPIVQQIVELEQLVTREQSNRI